ncbi:MAG TPA: hypothetical protein VNT55_07330 [Baekduia sp.]|nr:hypothetical protein [Baekduia sp.]
MKLPKLRRDAPAAGSQPRRRRVPRPDGPRTILPGGDDVPSWLPPTPPATPLARDLDAARERLRRAIPPVADEDE